MCHFDNASVEISLVLDQNFIKCKLAEMETEVGIETQAGLLAISYSQTKSIIEDSKLGKLKCSTNE